MTPTLPRLVATLGGIGYLRPASGTWASAVAILLGVGLHRLGGFPLLFLATALAVALGFWAVASVSAGATGELDRPEIVIDELAGQWIALCAPSAGFLAAGLPASVFPYPGWLAAFVFFRLFDIWKPWLVGRADRRADAAGVMIDDLWAGLFAAVATIVTAGVAHWVFMQ